MPSPKAVLRDIHDLKLDPRKAHTAIRVSGRLRKFATVEVASAPVLKEKPVTTPGLVKLPEPVAPPSEPVEVVAEIQQPVQDVAEAAPKKKPGFKKADKKDKPEEPPAA